MVGSGRILRVSGRLCFTTQTSHQPPRCEHSARSAMPVLVLLGIFLFGLPAEAKYGGGMGEPNDPYLIYTADQMDAIAADPNDWDRHFKLMADIDLGGSDFSVIGDHSNPFSGVLDGNGRTISNLTGTSGLFGCVNGPDAEIKNLGLIDPNVVGGPYAAALVSQLNSASVSNCYVEGGDTGNGIFYTGGLVGSNHGGTIDNCRTTGRVFSSRHILGGLVGWNGDHGTITDCSSSANVSSFATGGEVAVGGLVGENRGGIGRCFSTGPVSGRYSVGGLVGFNGRGVISDCYSHSTVTADQLGIGGLVGSNGAIVTNCYATGGVTGSSDVGGLVGRNSGTVTDCFWDIETGGQATSAGGIGKTTAEMKMASIFIDAGWDFKDVWDIAENQTYPFLRRHSPGDLNYDYCVDLLDLAILAEHWLEDDAP